MQEDTGHEHVELKDWRVNPFQLGETTAVGLLKPLASVLMVTVLLCPEDLYRKLEYTLGMPTLARVE